MHKALTQLLKVQNSLLSVGANSASEPRPFVIHPCNNLQPSLASFPFMNSVCESNGNIFLDHLWFPFSTSLSTIFTLHPDHFHWSKIVSTFLTSIRSPFSTYDLPQQHTFLTPRPLHLGLFAREGQSLALTPPFCGTWDHRNSWSPLEPHFPSRFYLHTLTRNFS